MRLGIALAAVAGLIVAASRAAAPAPPTKMTVYRPYVHGDVAPRLTVTRTAKGECFTGSLADPRRDAWRCEIGNEIADPCFSDRAVLSWVLCPEDSTPFGTRVVRLALSKALPKRLASKELPGQGYPWAVKLADRRVCTFLTGATYVYHRQRVDYGCDGKTFLAGTPNRSTATWTIILGTGVRSRPRTVPIAVAAW